MKKAVLINWYRVYFMRNTCHSIRIFRNKRIVYKQETMKMAESIANGEGKNRGLFSR